MELDGLTRVWHNMQDRDMYNIDGVTEVYPAYKDPYDDSLIEEAAEAVRDRADVALELDRTRNPDIFASPLYLYWLKAVVLADASQLRIELPNDVRALYDQAAFAAQELEKTLGRTGITIVWGSGFGFEHS